jgi:hypothetical protein
VGGISPRIGIWLLERLAPQLQPDIVTVGFFLNDISGVLRKDRSSRVDQETGARRRKQRKRFFSDRLIYFLKRSRVVMLIYSNVRRVQSQGLGFEYVEILRGRTPVRFEESWQLIEEALTRARDLGARQGFRLIVFPIPSQIEFAGEFPDEAYRSRFIALAQKLGLEHFDPTPAMRRDGVTLEDGFVPWDGHMNAESHDRMARMLRDQIRAEPDPVRGNLP